MLRLALLLTMACAAAHADTEICQSVNGRTTCTHASGNVSCTTINGETRCTTIEPDQVQPESPTMPDLSMPDITMPGIDIRQGTDGRLRVRAAGTTTSVELPP